MKVNLLLKLAIVAILAIAIQRENLYQGLQEQQTLKTVVYERCAQLGQTIKRQSEIIDITDADDYYQPDLAPYQDGFIVVYEDEDSSYYISKAIVDSSYSLIEDSNSRLFTSSGTLSYSIGYYPAIGLLSDGTYLVCYQYSNQIRCVYLDSEGATVEDTYDSDILTYDLDGSAYLNIKSLSNGYYGIFMIQDDNPQIAVIGSKYGINEYEIINSESYGPAYMPIAEYEYNDEKYIAILSSGMVNSGMGGKNTGGIYLHTAPLNSITNNMDYLRISDSNYDSYEPQMERIFNGKLLMCYSQRRAQDASNIVCRTCDPDVQSDDMGVKCSSEVIISDSTLTSSYFKPTMVLLENEQALITYGALNFTLDEESLYSTLIDPNTLEVLDSWLVDDEQTDDLDYTVVKSILLANGDVGLVWQDDDYGQIFGAVYRYIGDKDNDVHTTAFVLTVVLIPCGFLLVSALIYLKFFKFGSQAVKQLAKPTGQKV